MRKHRANTHKKQIIRDRDRLSDLGDKDKEYSLIPRAVFGSNSNASVSLQEIPIFLEVI